MLNTSNKRYRKIGGMMITCTPTHRVTLTPGDIDGHYIDGIAEPGDRLIDHLLLDQIILDGGEIELADSERDGLAPLVQEVLMCHADRLRECLTVTIEQDRSCRVTADLDLLDCLARDSRDMSVIAAADLVRSLRGRASVDLAGVAIWVEPTVITALAESMALLAK